MFDILKDSNGRFNKKNILPLIGIAFGSTVALSSAASLIYVTSTDYSLSVNSNMRTSNDANFLIFHALFTVVLILTSSLYICYSIDHIMENKQIENFIANSEPNVCVYNASVNDVSEEQNQL